MRIKFTFIAILFVVISCKTERTSDSSKDKSKTEVNSQNVVSNGKNFKIFEINKSEYFDAAADLEYSNLAEKFCNDSKGYQSNIWEGLNDCSWAIEKYQISNNDMVNRDGNRLILKLADGSMQSIEHTIDANVYYQFKHYIKEQGVFVIEEIKNGFCSKSHLIARKSKETKIIDGVIRPLKNGKEAFLIVCDNTVKSVQDLTQDKIEYGWELAFQPHKVIGIKVPEKDKILLKLKEAETGQSIYKRIEMF